MRSNTKPNNMIVIDNVRSIWRGKHVIFDDPGSDNIPVDQTKIIQDARKKVKSERRRRARKRKKTALGLKKVVQNKVVQNKVVQNKVVQNKVVQSLLEWPEGYSEKDGAGFIIQSSDCHKVLLVQDSTERSGKWGFPKGHRELYDINPSECAKRETHEETGLIHGTHYKSVGAPFKLNGNLYIFQNAFMYGDENKVALTCENHVSSVKWFDISDLKKRHKDGLTEGWTNGHLRKWLK
jgi:8-oxo-dGTP pyrophosphatase MutT (NUDIX family)